MKKAGILSLIVLAISTLMSFTGKKNTADSYTVAVDRSKIDWIGTKKNGYHPGMFSLKSGQIMTEAGKLTGGSFVIDIAGLKVLDGSAADLEKHLKSADFFEADKYPEASFTITGVNYTSETMCEISGTLNIKGNNVPMKFPAYIRSVDDKRFFGQAFFSLDRTLLGVAYSKSPVVNDVHVTINIFASK